MSRLTLNVDPEVVRRAKRFAARRGTSVSKLVTRYLDAVSRPEKDESVPPVLRRLRGALKGATAWDHARHLAGKYR